jgi:hypothetical protein
MKTFALTIICLFIAVSLAFADDAPKDKSGSQDKSITGCLSGPNAEGTYLLKTDKGSVEVGGNDELKSHVGHEVKLTGEWAKSGSAIGENESAEKKEPGAASAKGEKAENERHFKASKIDMVSDTCSTK